MNSIQKIFVMVFVGSIITFFIGVSIGTSGGFQFDESWRNMFRFGYTNDTLRPNWLSIISAFNIFVSAAGFFLFKDK